MRKYGLLVGMLLVFFLAAGSASAWLDASYPYRRTMSYSSDFHPLIPYPVNGTCGMWAIGNNTGWYNKVSGESCTDSADFKISDNADTAQANMTNETSPGQASYGNLWDGMTSLSARYDFNNNVLDSTSNNNNGGATNAVYTASGKFGGAMRFTEDNCDVPNSASLDATTNLTMALWFKLNAEEASTGYLFARKADAYAFTINSSEMLNFNLKAASVVRTNSQVPLNIGQWYCAVGTYDVTSGSKLYIDGLLNDTAPADGSIPDGNDVLSFGGHGASWYIDDATIDEAQLWNKTWSPEEVTAYCNADKINSLGSEEAASSDAAPTVTLSTPTNTTYYTTSIDFNFSVSDAEDATFHAIAYNDTDAIYDSAAYTNNTAMSFTLSETGGQQNVTVWANDSAGNEVSSEVLYYVWMGLNVSAYNNATNASMTDWSITATNGTFTYTNSSQNNPSMIEWNLLPQGTVNITIDDNSTTLYFYNTTYERTLNNSALVQLDAYLQPKSDNPISLTSSGGWSMLQDQSTTITCTASEATPDFQINSVSVSSPYILSTQTGTYTMICNVYSETENYAPANSSNTLLVNPLISCTNNQTFAFQKTVTTTTNITTLDFTEVVSQSLVRENLGDVYISTANNTWINTTGGYYVIVNNTGQSSFTVQFGNYFANSTYSTAGRQGDEINMTSYTQTNPYALYNILDELTGDFLFPPNATLTSIIQCSQGETYIPIDSEDTKFIIATQNYITKATLRVAYSADAYYSRQYYPDQANVLVLNFYVTDAFINALDRIDFVMQDMNHYSTKLQLYKTVQNQTVVITEGYFDASHMFSAYLIEDIDYYMQVVSASGSTTDFGRITIVAPATKYIGDVTMSLNPQATLIADNIFMNAWDNTDRTLLYVQYRDDLNQTNELNITVSFENGTVFQSANYTDTNSVLLEYNISGWDNETFVIEFSMEHDTFGNSPVQYSMGLYSALSPNWGLGMSSTVSALISLTLLVLVGGIASRKSLVAGSAMFYITLITLRTIGWLSISLLNMVFLGVLLALGIIVYVKKSGD